MPVDAASLLAVPPDATFHTTTTENRMSRIALSNGKWFDDSKATAFSESTRRNGNNQVVSNATGSQWEHEELYRTKGGTWVLHSWSQWQGSTPSYEIIGEPDAHAWLIRHNHHDAVPASVVTAAEV